MAYLEIDGQRHLVPQGELTVGSDPSAGIPLSGSAIAPRHLIVQGLPDGQVAVRLAEAGLRVKVNGVDLGPQPTPLLHGDKVEIAGHELRFVDERKSGSTQYVQAVDPALLAAAAKKPAKRGPTGTTGGRLVSLTDGREYAVTGASLVIGRDASCDVVVISKSVSRRHCEIMATPKGYVAVDSSTNGTLVNGQKIEGQQLLARGDVIQCGEHEFRFYADAAPVVPAEAPPPPAGPPPGPPIGAEQRLSDTLHGVPGAQPAGMPRPTVPESAPPVAAAVQPPPPPPPAAPQPPVAERPSAAKKAHAGPLAYLVVRSGDLKGQRIPIKVPNVNVGRADYNDIVIPDDSISTQHAKLQRREGIWMLVDLESTNGTLVDGEKVAGEVPLSPGSFIRFGTVSTMFEPTDDTVDAKKGSSTRVLGAIKLPQDKPPGT